MKNIFGAVLMFCAAVFAFAAGPESGAKPVRIGVSIPSADHGWTGGVVWAAEKAKKELEAKYQNVTVVLSISRDAAEQNDRIENLIVQRCDALVVLPHDPKALSSLLSRIRKQHKIFLVVVDRALESDLADVTVAGDNPGFGKACAEAMAKALGGRGNILVMEGIPCVVNTERVEAFRAVMKNYPGIHILESQTAGWNTENGLRLMENWLQKYRKIDAVWAGDDDVLIGALKAVGESGRKDIRLMVGGGGSRSIVRRIRSGDPLVPLTVTYPPLMIYKGVEVAIEGVRGTKTFGKKVVVPCDTVTKKNAEQFYFRDSRY